jgi:hypothetical protein
MHSRVVASALTDATAHRTAEHQFAAELSGPYAVELGNLARVIVGIDEPFTGEMSRIVE